MDVVPRPVRTATGPPTIAAVWADVSGRDLADQGLEWPPDVFALAGTVLGRTHAYRFAVSPPAGRHWPPAGSAPGTTVVTDAAAGVVQLDGGAAGAAAGAGRRRVGGAAGRGVGRPGRDRRRQRVGGLRGAVHAARPRRRGLRRRRGRPRPRAHGRLPVPRAGGRAARPHGVAGRRPHLAVAGAAQGPHAARRHLLPLAVALPLPARRRRWTSPGTRPRRGGRAPASSRPTCCCCPGRCASGSGTSGRCTARCGGRRTSRSASSSSPRPRRSTSTWWSGCSSPPSTRSTASTR